MRILVAHNEYQYRGGEDSVVEAEIALLREYGHEVNIYRRSNHELSTLSRASAAASSIWSYQSSNDIQQVCDSFNPEVIHAHNTFPLISPSLYWAAAKKKVPVVQTLHNFRLLCPQAMFLRNGKICEDCIGKLPWRAVAHKCYRGSVLQSAVTVTMLAQHRAMGTYQKQITLYIALNEFCRQKFIEGGLPSEKIHVKPHFVRSGKAPIPGGRHEGLFIGRLAEEKGLQILIDAMKELGDAQIKIAGVGPLEDKIKQAFGTRYIGPKNADELRELLSHARYLVAPSIGMETFGMVAIEAFESGTPVIASRQGGLNDIIADGVTGLLFNPADAHDLAQKIAWAESHPDQMLKMGQAARKEYERKYTPERNYYQLMNIYYAARDSLAQQNALSNAA